MDTSINVMHRILQDASLPSTIEDLKNPTEKYVVNLLSTFLAWFHIDINAIDQPISEQLTAMTYYDDSDVINLINLHTVVKHIFEKIFLHDFCLTDITSPGHKRLRKQAKFLSNFVLYAMHKKPQITEKMNEIQNAVKLLEELKEKKAQVSESFNNKIMHKAKQLSMIEKLEYDIQQIELNAENIDKKVVEVEAVKTKVEKENLKTKEVVSSLRINRGKLTDKVTDIQSEVINSPEKYKSRLDEIKSQKALKEEERGRMEEVIQDKKRSAKRFNEKLSLVQKVTNEFCILANILQEHKSKKEELNNTSKEIDLLNNTSSKLKTESAMHESKVNAEKTEINTHREDILLLCNQHKQLLSEKKIQKTKIDNNRDCYNEKSLKISKLQAEIKVTEEKTTAFMKSCQEAYDKEIAEEKELRKAWEGAESFV
ncbi:PREDICTED: probable kinetochore protein nuf2 [Vollenhovia emeryi]|uniref:probable kinetochore protein nuf2 n=1 Tax=Vollenhovia emeryi TaxID=411798 RepID=UPI0005F49099|nr:PREDICTED: probable kinetochore protein nuf2 [Vollenhovia emeryi]XP_011875447.1 PREDICTED: probable kinetochore protein nuf2 [Vollenhovia emeryi]